MTRFKYTEALDKAGRVLFAKHDVAVGDQYGKCIKAGYTIDGTQDDETVRVTHCIPELTALDDGYDDRMSSDEMAAERHRMVDAYAATLTAAGWTVERRGPRSRKPYLLAYKP